LFVNFLMHKAGVACKHDITLEHQLHDIMR
jgi:hypothetical protein